MASTPSEPADRPENGAAPSASRSLYRRHRPRSFQQLVGQEAVARTLSNAVEQGRVHHAYLFVGSRGTGKTSTAKILAASLNCEHGPTAAPCGECATCRAIAQASSLDVVEMDAASNNSVEDIRELRDSIAFAPVSGRYKVYILDEAHMLTQAAWNAFLKTLEEPPPNTVFVLATTEAQKVPATVVDRCHRFDFRRPAAEQIVSVLGRVCEAEGYEVPPEAQAAIARAATGSFRDALGTLEQIITYSGKSPSVEDVLAVLGAVDSQLLEEMVAAAGNSDPAAALLVLGRALEQGRDPAALLSGLEERARELLVVQAIGQVTPELSLTPEHDLRLAAQAQALAPQVVVGLLEGLAFARQAMRSGGDARTYLELALAKVAGLAQRAAAAPTSEPAYGASTSEVAAAAAAAITAVPAPRPAPAEIPLPAASSAAAPTSDSPVAESPAGEPPAAGFSAAGASSRQAPSAETPTAEASPSETPAAAPSPVVQESEDPAQPPAELDVDPEPLGAEGTEQAAARQEVNLHALGAAPEQSPVVEQPAPAAANRGDEAFDLDLVAALWPQALAAIRAENALIGATLGEAQPVAVDGDAVTLAFAEDASFFKRKAEDPANVALATRVLKGLASRPVRLAFELRESVQHAQHPPEEEALIEHLMAELDAQEIAGGPAQ